MRPLKYYFESIFAPSKVTRASWDQIIHLFPELEGEFNDGANMRWVRLRSGWFGGQGGGIVLISPDGELFDGEEGFIGLSSGRKLSNEELDDIMRNWVAWENPF